ncbi:MAG: isoprenylcysteine carboxylmethyltransferase family protein, partial [Bacteroidota bacterium]
MDSLLLKIAYVVLIVGTFIIRYPHEKRNKNNSISEDNKTALEKMLLLLVFIGMMILPLIFIFTSFFSFANYTLPVYANVIGIVLIIPTLWLFYRSHKDLGRNWSVSLEIREDHKIIDSGV